MLATSGTFQALILKGQPMQSDLENGMLMFNEIMVSVYLYILLVLTDFFAEVNPHRENSGWALVLALLVTFAVNLIKFLIVLGMRLR